MPTECTKTLALIFKNQNIDHDKQKKDIAHYQSLDGVGEGCRDEGGIEAVRPALPAPPSRASGTLPSSASPVAWLLECLLFRSSNDVSLPSLLFSPLPMISFFFSVLLVGEEMKIFFCLFV